MTLMRVVLAPFDRGLYWVGLFFRQCAVIAATLNPYWRFRTAGNRPPDPRRPYVVVSNHESFADILLIQPPPLGNEVALEGGNHAHPCPRLGYVPGRRHSG